MENNPIWFYAVLIVGGSWLQYHGFWGGLAKVLKFVLVEFWQALWKWISSIPGKLARLGGSK